MFESRAFTSATEVNQHLDHIGIASPDGLVENRIVVRVPCIYVRAGGGQHLHYLQMASPNGFQKIRIAVFIDRIYISTGGNQVPDSVRLAPPDGIVERVIIRLLW